MNNQKFEVSIDFVIDALQARYDNVKELRGGDAEYIEQKWDEYVTNNACLYNDDYACLSF